MPMRYVIFTLCFLIFLLAVFLFIDSVKADCNITIVVVIFWGNILVTVRGQLRK
jgi:hypothetical protein